MSQLQMRGRYSSTTHRLLGANNLIRLERAYTHRLPFVKVFVRKTDEHLTGESSPALAEFRRREAARPNGLATSADLHDFRTGGHDFNYLMNKHGTTLFASWQLTPSQLTPSLRKDIQFCAKFIATVREHQPLCTRNGAQVAGEMLQFGSRTAYEADHTAGTYASKPGHEEESFALYRDANLFEDKMHRILSYLDPTAMAATHDQLASTGVPSLGQRAPDVDILSTNFAGHLTVTTSDKLGNGFANLAHCDRDASWRVRQAAAMARSEALGDIVEDTEKMPATTDEIRNARDAPIYTGGMFFHADPEKNIIQDMSVVRESIEGGHFHVPGYGHKVDFGAAPVTILLWRGPLDSHGTVQWKASNPSVRRFGSSLQIPTNLVHAFRPGGKLVDSEGQFDPTRYHGLEKREAEHAERKAKKAKTSKKTKKVEREETDDEDETYETAPEEIEPTSETESA